MKIRIAKYEIFALSLTMLSLLISSSLFSQLPFSQDQHYLIVGSYNNYQTAEFSVQQYEAMGLRPEIHIAEGLSNLFRVSIYSSFSKEEVQRVSRQYKARGQFPKAWILTKGPVSGNTTRDPFPAQVERTGITYYLIAGSLSSYDQALLHAQGLQTKGLDPMVILPNTESPSYKVAIYFSHDLNEIRAYKDAVDRSGSMNLWVFQSTELHPDRTYRSQPESDTDPVFRTSPVFQGNSYHLIGASYANLFAAEKGLEAFIRQGFSDAVLISPGSNSQSYRVSIYHALNRRDVEYFKNQLAAQGKTGFWILNP